MAMVVKAGTKADEKWVEDCASAVTQALNCFCVSRPTEGMASLVTYALMAEAARTVAASPVEERGEIIEQMQDYFSRGVRHYAALREQKGGK